MGYTVYNFENREKKIAYVLKLILVFLSMVLEIAQFCSKIKVPCQEC